jgi:hypothetical protein
MDMIGSYGQFIFKIEEFQMAKIEDSKGWNFNTKNIIFNFISDYKESAKNNIERTSVLVKEYANKLKTDFNIIDNQKLPYAYFLFFYNVLLSSYEYLEIHFKEKMLRPKYENRILILQYKNALRLFGSISYLMQTQDFTSSLILFRVLYENLVILNFLLKNPDCIGEFDEYSIIKLKKLYDIYGLKTKGITKLSKIGNDTIQYTQRDIEKKIKKNYDWAKIEKNSGHVNFHDIEYEVFKNNNPIKENMINKYNLISDLVHANTSIFSHPEMDTIQFQLLFDCFEQMAFPLIVDTFFKLFKFAYNGQFSYEMKPFDELFFILFPHVYPL